MISFSRDHFAEWREQARRMQHCGIFGCWTHPVWRCPTCGLGYCHGHQELHFLAGHVG